MEEEDVEGEKTVDVVDSVELSWKIDVEDLSRSYRFPLAPEDKKLGCTMQVLLKSGSCMFRPASSSPKMAAKEKSCRQ
jgi:hypothetical protein